MVEGTADEAGSIGTGGLLLTRGYGNRLNGLHHGQLGVGPVFAAFPLVFGGSGAMAFQGVFSVGLQVSQVGFLPTDAGSLCGLRNGSEEAVKEVAAQLLLPRGHLGVASWFFVASVVAAGGHQAVEEVSKHPHLASVCKQLLLMCQRRLETHA